MPFHKDRDTHKAMRPEKALQLLKDGNQRFVNNQMTERDLSKEISLTIASQFPIAVVLSCIDSRVTPNIIFDQGFGDLFNVKIAGNIVNDDILGSLEFACKIIGTKLIVVLGHTSCGAIMGACDRVKIGKLTGLLEKIEPAIQAVKTSDCTNRNSKDDKFVNQVAHKNVELTIENIKLHSNILRKMVTSGEIMIAGAMYNIKNGAVEFL